MNILIEGWRGINHSYSLVNQWQIKELKNKSNIFFNDVPFISANWNIKKNDSGLDEETKNLINNLNPPSAKKEMDITYRISGPYNFDSNFNSSLLFIFGTCEQKFLDKGFYINGSPEILSKEKKIFIHTPSNWSKEGFIKAGFNEEQVIVIPHGVDTETFNLLPEEEIKEIKKHYKLNDDDFVLCNIGAMTENKGVDFLIAAYGILKKKFKNLKLILKDQSNLYGVKPNYIFNKLRESTLNKKYNIINSEMLNDIVIISKNLNLEEIKNIYSITDCYVSPYLAEGFNLTPLEAAACGTKILVTKGGSTDDYFDNCMGFQIESEEKKIHNLYQLNPKLDSLVNLLEREIKNKSDTSRKNRAKFVHNNFSWKKIAEKLFNEFEKKLAKKT